MSDKKNSDDNEKTPPCEKQGDKDWLNVEL